MSRYCLDTSAYSHFKRGHPPIVELVDRASWIGMPATVLGELEVGFQQGVRLETNRRELAEFLREPVVEELQVDWEIGQIYAEIFIALRGAGTPIPVNDIWIAAATARSGATVLTYDDHFASIQRVGSVILPSP